MKSNNIRNFSIIAHIDHGKSTLSDRIIEKCSKHKQKHIKEQMLDSMDLEREKGITIKAQTIRLTYQANNGINYIFNLIDTPGHADFGYEVNRALAACEGVILVIDATQGVEAQTLSNTYKAIQNNLKIILVLNKIDLSTADPEKAKREIKEIINIDNKDTILISSKTGYGVDRLLESIIVNIPPPQLAKETGLQILVIDSWYNLYLGVIIIVRIIQGVIKKGLKIKMLSNNKTHIVEEVGIFTPKKCITKQLTSGEVGYIICNIKNIDDCKIGDTITNADQPTQNILPGFKASKPVVFCSLYPEKNSQYNEFKKSIEKLKLNDSSFVYSPEKSKVLGLGMHCGFLGLLHLEIIKERLKREYNIQLIATAPSVMYKVYLRKGTILEIKNANELPDINTIKYIEEPWSKVTIISPNKYIGHILKLCTDNKGVQISIHFLNNERVIIVYEIPLNKIIFSFYNQLQSISKGYASYNWEITKYQQTNIIKVDIFINHHKVNALSFFSYKEESSIQGKKICLELKKLIPKQLFQIAIQASVGKKIISRETLSGFKKDVTSKCYGGDVTRKQKLLNKQKKGKRKMMTLGKVNIPQSAFTSLFKI